MERYKAQNELLIQAYEKIHKTLDELKKTEDLLVESEKLASLGELIATISHEIKSPLGAISAANNIISEFASAIPIDTFKVARMLSEKEFKAVLPLMSFVIDKEQIYKQGQKNNREQLENSLRKLGVTLSDDLTELVSEIDVERHMHIKDFLPVLKSPNAKGIIEYLASYLMLKTSIWIARNSIDRAVKLVDELKNYSYRNTGRHVLISLPKSINNILTIYRSKLNSIEIVRDFDDVKITGDPDRLSQVWTNIIMNAAQASNFGGKIEVSIKEDDQKVSVSIKDYAGGIPKEIQNKVFQAFFTTKEKGEGTGLGLSVVKRIIEEHKGHIHFEVEDGIGTNAIIEFKKRKE
ncbi:MAG: ATP-binding protein [Ekhidna sp.]